MKPVVHLWVKQQIFNQQIPHNSYTFTYNTVDHTWRLLRLGKRFKQYLGG